jgi:uncharacterized protein (DUF1501 family)
VACSCTRRSFMKGGALALLGLGSVPRFLVRTAYAEGSAAGPKIVVAIFQRGAADGLSMVVPHGDPSYYDSRGSIAIARPSAGNREATIDLDGFFGLHPSMAPLKAVWDDRHLAIVHACGSPDTTRSHFDAQDFMESGTPGVKTTADGWLARGLEALPVTGRSSFRAVAMGSRLPRTLRGDIGAIAMGSVGDFDVKQGMGAMGGVNARAGFESMYEQGVKDILYGTGRETFEAVKMLKAANPQRFQPDNGAQYPRGPLGNSLRQIAQLIKADIGLEVAFADMGGWDTHAAQGNEKGQLASRLAEFSQALAALYLDLGDRMAEIVVVTMSEFGRTVRENGNRGTDHGHATAMLVLGGPVKGGRVAGRWPGLAREQLFEGRDLAVTTDFRNLFGEIADRHLGVPATAPLFPGFVINPAGYPGVLV